MSIGGPSPDPDVARFSIEDLVDNTIFKFHSFPDSFSEDKSANWSSTEPQGRSSPLWGYAGSQARTFSMSLHLYSSIVSGDGRTPQDVKEACDWFISLPYPDYSGSTIQPPHRVRLTWAAMRTMDCIVNNVSISYGEDPWDTKTGLPMGARLTISLAEVDDTPKDVYDVRGS